MDRVMTNKRNLGHRLALRTVDSFDEGFSEIWAGEDEYSIVHRHRISFR